MPELSVKGEYTVYCKGSELYYINDSDERISDWYVFRPFAPIGDVQKETVRRVSSIDRVLEKCRGNTFDVAFAIT